MASTLSSPGVLDNGGRGKIVALSWPVVKVGNTPFVLPEIQHGPVHVLQLRRLGIFPSFLIRLFMRLSQGLWYLQSSPRLRTA